MFIDDKERMKYSVGGLLYAPGMSRKVPQKVRDGAFPSLTSLAFCLEDTIQDDRLEEAELTLKEILGELSEIDETKRPLIFVRIRTPEHMKHIISMYKEYDDVIAGYLLPKFDLSNMDEYISLISEINSNKKDGQRPTYIMPILESKMVADVATRVGTLTKIKESLDTIKDYVLNVRVGGNDFCNLYGVRRNASQTIYDIGVIRDIFVDIINIFAADYVVSGPVWEYFGPKKDGVWDKGLERELELDRLNGFIGKTAIHPTQLPSIYESLKVTRSDYEDAKKILGWDKGPLGVAKSEGGNRMNEVKVHTKWAKKTSILAQIYGVKEDGKIYRAGFTDPCQKIS